MVRGVLIAILIAAALSGCRYTRWTSGSGGSSSVVQRLDGTYLLESTAAQCEGPIKSTSLYFDLLERLSDGARVSVQHTQSVERRPHFVCFNFSYPERPSAQRCVDLWSPEYNLTKTGIEWSPRVRQSFPYNLGVSRRYLRGKVTALSHSLIVEQELKEVRAGLIGAPRFGSEVVRCELKRVDASAQ